MLLGEGPSVFTLQAILEREGEVREEQESEEDQDTQVFNAVTQ